jgi:hypothetical protein
MNMQKYVACVIIDVADDYKDRKPDKESIKRYLQNVVIQRAVEESFFRQKVLLKIEKVKIEVHEA